jgi:hypothetical protein
MQQFAKKIWKTGGFETISLLLRGNHLPVSDVRWQHGSQICFVTFI